MGAFDDLIPAAQPSGGAAPDAQATVPRAGAFDDLVPKTEETPETHQDAPIGRLGHAAAMATDVWPQIKKAGSEAIEGINAGLNPFSEENEASFRRKVEKPFSPSAELDDLARTNRGLLSVPGLVFSPLTGLVRSVVGHGLSATMGMPFDEAEAKAQGDTTGMTASNEADIASMLVAPRAGIRAPGVARAPTPPPEAPFGVELSEGQETGDKALIKREQAANRDQLGAPASKVAKPWFDRQAQQVEAAKDVATAQLSPAGEIVARTPQEAGTVISDTLKDAEAQRSQAVATEGDALNKKIADDEESLRPKGLLHPHEAADTVSDALRGSSEALTDTQQQRVAQVERDREGLRGSLNNDGTVIARNPQEASDIISAGVTRAEEQATAVRDAAYDKFDNMPGSFRPQVFTDVAGKVTRDLNDPKDPFLLNDQTKNTADAIKVLDEKLGEPARVAADPDTKAFRPFTPSMVNNVRKDLNLRWRAANDLARSTNNYSDLEGMNRVMDSFNGIVSDALNRNRIIGGNGRQIKQAWDDANASHAYLRKTFSRQGSGDTVGPVMSKIVGQREGQAMPANAIEQATMGKGGQPVLVGRRLQSVFGPTSPEIGALKQGAFSKAVEPAEGMDPFPPEKIANNLHDLASSELGRTHFTPEELSRIRQHANDTRASVTTPKASTDVVGRAIDKINGVGGQPWTSEELSGHLFGKDGTGPTPLGEKLTQHVLDTYGPDSPEFQAIQRGQISSLTRTPQGAAGFEPKAIAKDIRGFLDDNPTAANRLYSPEQQAKLRAYADKLDNHATQSEAALDAQAARTKIPQGDSVEKAIARITGRDGGPGASPMEVANMIASRSSPADKATSLGIIRRLKQLLTPEKFSAIKQAIFRQTIEPGPSENNANWGSQKIVGKIADLFNKAPDLVNEVFSPEDKQVIKAFQNLHQKLTVPQDAVQWSNNSVWATGLKKMLSYVAGSVIGAPLGAALGFPGVGELVGLAGAHVSGVVKNEMTAKAVAKQLNIVAQRMKDYQKALAASQRAALPYYKTRAVAAGESLSNAVQPFGIDMTGIFGAAAQDDKNKKTGPQDQKRNGGGVNPQTRAHGGTVSDSSPTKAKNHPVITGARLAPDGEYYLADPNRPGKYLKVIERGRQHAAA